MLRGLYTAAAGMLATTISTDTLANNLSNVNTTGFKRSGVNFQSFPEMLIQRMSDQGSEQVGSIMTGSKVRESIINFTQGTLRETGATFDLALEGDGFFTLKETNEPNAKTYYTRAGNFMVNEEGYLTTAEGAYVQGELGSILLSLDEGPFKINQHGEILAKNRLVDRIKVSRFMDNNALKKMGDNLYEAYPSATQQPTPPLDTPLGYRVHQGRLEQSNTNVVTELVNNIQGLRLYEALQKNIHFHNETLGKAVNEVGRSR